MMEMIPTSNKVATLIFLLTAFATNGLSLSDCGFSEALSLEGRLPEGNPVYGVAVFGQNIYVIRDSTPRIEVYDAASFTMTKTIPVATLNANMTGPYDMVSSDNPPTLYIADWFQYSILFVVKVSDESISTWSVSEDAYTSLGLTGASVFTRGAILVTAAVSQMVKTFSTNGMLISQVQVQNISSPRQSVQMSGDKFAVCYGYGPAPALHQVCLVNKYGQTMKCYGGIAGSGVGQLNIPARLERNRGGCILIADDGNKRVVLLDRELHHVNDLLTAADGLQGPYRLHLDEANKVLYVADNTVDSNLGYATTGRVFIFKTG